MNTKLDSESGARILLVEDEQTVVQLFEEVLVDRGYPFDAVENVELALGVMADNDYDLVITDKNLPGESNGLDLLKLAKESDPDLEVIMITGYADMDSAIEAIRGGVYDYITKPFNSVDDVFHRVKGALTKRRITLENMRLIKSLEALNRDLEAKVKERTLQLEKMTLTDDLTGLYNQRFLYQRLPEEIERSQRFCHPLSLVMLDVDHFKQVNDCHDHLFGSTILRRLGELLNKNVRTVDMVIRYGGDEFVIILPEMNLKNSVKAAERLRVNAETADLGDDGKPFHVSISVGVAALGDTESTDAKTLLKAADRALYASKEAGRNRVMAMRAGETIDLQSIQQGAAQ
jgi:diguanylate cyclase (GGDEF)-like protein